MITRRQKTDRAVRAAFYAVEDELHVHESPLYREAACGTQWDRTPEWEARREELTRLYYALAPRFKPPTAPVIKRGGKGTLGFWLRHDVNWPWVIAGFIAACVLAHFYGFGSP